MRNSLIYTYYLLTQTGMFDCARQASPQELQYSPQWRQLITALAAVLVSVC
jgi:hypothetical protein